MANEPRKKAEFIENPNPLRSKVRVLEGVDPSELLQRAERSIAKLADTFEESFERDVRDASELMRAARADAAKVPDSIRQIRRILHDLRGQAGTFGYPLVSRVGDAACKFIDACPQIGAHEVEVTGMHVDALNAILTAKLKGDGGPVGQELVRGLDQVVKRHAAGKLK